MRAGQSLLALGLLLLLCVMLGGVLQTHDAFIVFDDMLMRAAGVGRDRVGGYFTDVAIWLSLATDITGRFIMLAIAAPVIMMLQNWRRWVWLAAVTIGAMLINYALKLSFQATRPEVIPHLDPTMTFSFPSGHASGNMAFFAALALLLGSRSAWAIAMALAIAVGFSRVWLGVHWPSDVIFGWIEGVALVLIAKAWLPHSADGGHSGK